LEAAVEVTEKFVPKDEIIVSTKGMVQEVDRVIKARGEPVCEYCPLVVLVDGGSASAAEIVAGAIQDLDRGVIVGERTFGKGLVQSLVSFKNGTELKLTTAKYFTPSGRLIQKTDYFGDENPVILQDASVKEGEDQAVKYFTKNGREVFGGGGITPDIEVKYDETSKLEAGLLGGSFFFSFANEYMSKASAETALNDTLLFSKFKSYLQQKNFNYKVEGQSELEALRKIVEAKGVGTEFQKSLDELAQALEAGKKRELEENRGKLERYLRQEFGFRSSGSEGRLKVSASGDEQLQKAILTLKNTSAYQSILSNSSTAGK
jgi:carboxyl-terminal processing protease